VHRTKPPVREAEHRRDTDAGKGGDDDAIANANRARFAPPPERVAQ
jgi:hypothetical protein